MTLPAIGRRLARSLLGWSLVWSLAVAAAVWLAAKDEAVELLDDTLMSSAEVLASLMVDLPATVAAPPARVTVVTDHGSGRFAWQVVGPQGQLLARSSLAPAQPWVLLPQPGFGVAGTWRLYALALGAGGRVLYVGQTFEERYEAQADIALSAALAALALGLLGHVWLRARVSHELAPLNRLSQRLSGYDPLAAGASLGAAEREELQPVQAAIDELARRLARRVAHERAFTAHAAHALRTPLAGIDAQLAVALREAPATLQPRLQRVRDAAGRLQRVVAALLALFRSGVELQPQPVDLGTLLARLPADGLQVEVPAGATLVADPDLLTAALVNLLDNAVRHGAHRVRVSLPRPGQVRLEDDGPGVPAERRIALQQALDAQAYEGRMGLGLMLADMVARSHGGRLLLPPTAAGFAAELHLAP